jgi:hypothetical protein
MNLFHHVSNMYASNTVTLMHYFANVFEKLGSSGMWRRVVIWYIATVSISSVLKMEAACPRSTLTPM